MDTLSNDFIRGYLDYKVNQPNLTPRKHTINPSKNITVQKKKNIVTTPEIKRHSNSKYSENNSLTDSLKRVGFGIGDSLFNMLGYGLIINWLHHQAVSKFIEPILQSKANINPNQIFNLAADMVRTHELDKTGLQFFYSNKNFESYYLHIDNKVVIGKDFLVSIFHEIGHAVIEHKTKILKLLQRFRTTRNNYTYLAVFLYTFAKAEKKNNKDKKDSLIGDLRDFLARHKNIIPFVAFSPVLITEMAASKYGLDFLKSKVNTDKCVADIIRAVRNKYIAAFLTYLLVPVTIVTVDELVKKAKNTDINSIDNSPITFSVVFNY